MNRVQIYLIILLSLLLGNFSAVAKEQQETNILFIGNSFTARHNLSFLVKTVLEEGKPELKVNVSDVIYGGQSMFQHAEYYFSHTFIQQHTIDIGTIENRIGKMQQLMEITELPQDYIHFWQDVRKTSWIPEFPKSYIEIAINRHKSLLNNNPRTKWDYVVLQSWMDEVDDLNDGYAKYALTLANIAKEQGAEIILYITAPDIQNPTPVTEPKNQEEVDREINFALQLAKEINPYAVVHVPLAINMIQQGGTDLTFCYKNDFHPNQRTAFLTANMFYAAFFNESTEGFQFNTITENKTHSTDAEPNVNLDPDGGPATVVFGGEEKIDLQQTSYEAVMKFVGWWKGKDTIPVSEISIVNAPSDTVDLGKNYQLQASVKPLYATNKSLLWQVTSGNAVTVDENGLVTTVAEGKATIKVTTANGLLSDSCIL
ncbi:MAG TPA: Ig-like domain-containing protein, partial [Draconibacterium sp.]|nr:Ig-like domain-containing protein [Draconibacterium sp.]